MEKIIFATGNRGKLKEVRDIFKDTEYEIVAPFELGDDIEVDETDDTFEGNAFLKAEAIYKVFKLPVVADDSGLEVEQLNGIPGVFSARYAGEGCTYDENNNKLINELKSFPEPHLARFVSCAIFYDGVNKLISTGFLPGRIIDTKRGTNGFGYDPIFIPENEKRTLSEMSLKEKNKISHRKESFQKLKEMIRTV